MNKTLVLAEKPSVGRDLARVLNCNKKGEGYFEGERYLVTWALGHLVTLADPDVYDNKYSTWKLEDLPMLPTYLKIVVIKKTGKQFNIVKTQINRSDVREIVIATDAGREGELVARWILEKVQTKKPLKRLWISSVTDKAIRDGFNKLQNGRNYENLYASAVARAEADWLVGINATRALTCRHNAQLSCGRVQTPTLAIIAGREEEIKKFKPKTYYGLQAVTDGMKFTWHESKTKETRIFDKDKCDQILKSLQGKAGKVAKVEKIYKKTNSPHLYDLTELQREANKRFDFSAKETLVIMQKLYEQHKLVSYPRTDSRYLSTDMVDTLKDRVKACNVHPYTNIAGKVLSSSIKANKNFIDNSQVSDHHAIIPTEQKPSLGALTDKERKIYDLVVRRFLAVLYPPFEYEETTITVIIDNEQFTTKGKRVIASGWKEVYGTTYEEEEKGDNLSNPSLPVVNKDEIIKITSLSQTKGETKPPEYFTEGTLLSAMENPTKYMADEDERLIKTIGKTGGLGTVATRADVIEKLFNTFLLEKKGKYIYITSKGKQLLHLVPDELKSPTLTAEWELKLESISKGELNKDTFINEMKNYAKAVVYEIKNVDIQYRHENITGNKCPVCGKNLLEVNGKKGKMLVCQDRECGYRKGLSKTTNARCPNCHKMLSLYGEGEGQIFICKCGYREKMSSFQKRKENDKANVSKKDVAKYLDKQQSGKEEMRNPALAEALAKLKLKKKE